MELLIISIFVIILTCASHSNGEGETLLSSVLTPDTVRQGRSYGYGRPYDRDDRPSRCGRCDDDDDDDYDRSRERDDDRRSNRPTYGSRNDRNRNDKDDDRYDNDRQNSNKNGTDDESDGKKRHDDKDRDRDRHHGRRDKNKNRYDDRDKYRPDYYDRFLRDPYRDRYDRDRDRYYDDPYPRRPSYDDRYGDYGRYDPYSTSGYRRPYYEDRYDRGDAYGGYGPGIGRGPHETFRPWDETYRGQAGWDAGGRGYYFASGRPDSTWGQREYSRPSGGGWQNVGYSNGITGYRDQVYRGSSGYGSSGLGYGSGSSYGSGSGYGSGSAYGSGSGYNSGSVYGSGSGYSPGLGYSSGSGYGSGYADGYQDLGYGSSGWRNVGERRPYRDQSGVAATITRVVQDNQYGNRQPSTKQTYKPATHSQSTTLATSYLHQRDEHDTKTDTTVPPAPF